MTSERYDILYLSRVLWDSLYQRPQYLATELAQRFRVLYVDTPRATFYHRFIRPLRSGQPVRPFLWQAAPGLTVLSPPYVPFLPKWWPPPGQYLLTRLFVSWALGRLKIASPIVWMADPRDTYILASVKPRLLCYDCMDDYALIAPSPTLRPVLRAKERAVLGQADLVFASSQALAERCGQENRHVVLLPNGVAVERFLAATTTPPPADLAAIPRPRLGYIGSLAPWVDLDLLAAIARARSQWSVVLVGPVVGGVDRALAALKQLPNIHILGERPHHAIPSYVHGFDVCLIPFHVNELTQAVNPLKLFEYMAAGRPVVAAPLRELLRFAPVCAIADGLEAFLTQIESALTGSTPKRVEQRLAVARANTWAERGQAMTDAIMQALARQA